MFSRKQLLSLLICVSVFSVLLTYMLSQRTSNLFFTRIGSKHFAGRIVPNSKFRMKIIEANKIIENINNHVNVEVPTRLCDFCVTPDFLQERKPFVALASYPGSGNSWTRELIEAATGVYTGSMYPDGRSEFPGSMRCPLRGGVYIVKTHAQHNRTKHRDCDIMHAKSIDFQMAMLILRNPYDAVLSLCNLVHGGKVGFAERDYFLSQRWQTFIRNQAKKWTKNTLYWLTTFKKPVHVIVYEKLKANTVNELSNMGTFLHWDTDDLDLHCASKCLKPKYHRATKPDWMKTSTLFLGEAIHVVNDEISIVKSVLQKHNFNILKQWNDIEQALNSYIMEPSISHPHI